MPSPRLLHTLNNLPGTRKTLEKGEMLFQAGDTPEYVILVESGKVSLLTKGIAGYARALDNLPIRRKLWGLKEIMLGKEYGLSAEVLEKTCVVLIEKQELISLSRLDPAFRMELMQCIAREINEHHALAE